MLRYIIQFDPDKLFNNNRTCFFSTVKSDGRRLKRTDITGRAGKYDSIREIDYSFEGRLTTFKLEFKYED